MNSISMILESMIISLGLVSIGYGIESGLTRIAQAVERKKK